MFYREYNIQDYQQSGEVVFIISYLSSDLSEGSLVLTCVAALITCGENFRN